LRPRGRLGSAASVSRRTLLRAAGVSVLSLLLPAVATATPLRPRWLEFENLHTGEILSVAYHSGARYIPEALEQVNHLLRDHRTDEVHPIDPRLLDLLHEARSRIGTRASFQVISGFRSPATNAMLIAKGHAVGRRSLHMKGMAVDARLADTPTRRLHAALLALRRGGVGYYENPEFVHLDVGRYRTW
jgi:uncharacterized protein YcbK (DUF882 family)